MEKIMWGVEGGQKTLTGCGLLGGGERIMTVSLDQHLKVYNGLDGQVTYQEKFKAPIFSLAISSDDKLYALGMSDGGLIMKKYGRSLEEEKEKEDDGIPDFLKYFQYLETMKQNLIE